MKPFKTLSALALALTFAATGCDVDKTQDGELPEVDIDVDGGKLPKYDIDGPDVDIGSKKVEVTVPTVDVDLPEDDDDLEEIEEN